jgi:hypothetical protein
MYPGRTRNEVNRLFARPWFGRAWTVQEVVVARDVRVRCGKREIRLDHLQGAVQQLLQYPYANTAVDQALLQPIARILDSRVAWEQLGGFSLCSLLWSFLPWESTDPRDKVYAFLGLVGDIKPGDIEVDYTMPTDKMYTQLVRSLISAHGNLDILSLAQVPPEPKREANSPTWAPDLVQLLGHGRPRPLLAPFSIGKRKFNASGNCQAFPQSHGDCSKLVLDAHLIGKIVHVGTPQLEQSLLSTVSYPVAHSQFPTIVEWECLVLSSPEVRSRYGSVEQVLKTLLRILVAQPSCDLPSTEAKDGLEFFNLWTGRSTRRTWPGNFFPADSLPASASAVECFSKYLDSNMVASLKDKAFAREFLEWIKNLLNTVWGRSILITSQGHIGLCLWNTKVGDDVFVIRGGQTPYVLRKNNDHYIFVGEAYISKLMDGSAVEIGGTGIESLERIELR